MCTHRDAWHKLGTLSKLDAMESYIKLVEDLDSHWQETTTAGHITYEGKGGGGGGPVVSTLMKNDDAIPDEKKNMFDWCKEGNVTKLAAVVTQREVNIQDEEVCPYIDIYLYVFILMDYVYL